MTPPPSPNLPLTQRVLALAQTLQFAWFIGHLTLLFSVVRYLMSCLSLKYYSTWGQLTYRSAFISAAATYGIVVYKAYRARLRAGSRQPQQGPLALLADENVQYLVIALMWLLSRQIVLAMLPFAVYSIFHVATYTRTNLIPTFQPSAPTSGSTPGSVAPGASPSAKPQVQSSPLADTIGRFVKQYYDHSMGLVAGLEVLIWFRLLFSFLTFSRGAIFLFVVYTAFLRVRYAQNSFVQSNVQRLTARIDATVANQGTPPMVRQAWGTTKDVIRQVADLTDVSPYLGGAGSTGPKKAQ